MASRLHKIASMFAAVFNSVLRAMLGPMCAACEQPLDAPLDGAICPACRQRVPSITPPICHRCGDRLSETLDEEEETWNPEPPDAVVRLCGRCRHNPPPVSLARSAGVYDGALRDLIHALKYQRRRMIAPWLSARMQCAGAAVLDGADAVVPVPLHAWRQWQRGFNQADDLAVGLGLPVWRVLRRHRGGPPQASLPAAARHANARNAYKLCRRECLRQDRLRGSVVVLVDDVMTTGATLHACAAVLQNAGVSSVRALTAARAVAARPLQSPRTRHPSTVRR